MARNLQLGLESNWNLVYSNSFSGVVIVDDMEQPFTTKILEIAVPIIFDKPIIAVNVYTTVPVGRIWKYAGYLRRSLTTGLGASFVGQPESLFLGKFNLLIFEDLNINYYVSIQVPKWFTTANISVYQYEGIDTTTLEEDVQAIKSALGI
ncbi:hypothetical protein NIES4103_70270 (plasmid) [Nostoc sp. NIES-4103]|nr:hypothetical protein NIES4103_27390 [Nostoc sp. NIES-4103]BAZ54342.1 hypothetical protein NIES4103_70270 [Nostoc sp. NIES-4103]